MATAMVASFGEATGTTYVSIHTASASSVTHGRLRLTNVTGSPILVRAYQADGSWTTGEPTAGTLESTICLDLQLEGGATVVLGCALGASDEIVVRSNTASSLDSTFWGVEET